MSDSQLPTSCFSIIPSARDEPDMAFAASKLDDTAIGDRPRATEAAYFSRRAREELGAAIHANGGKARRAHLRLAEAYDCRAHLLTEGLRRDAEERLW